MRRLMLLLLAGATGPSSAGAQTLPAEHRVVLDQLIDRALRDDTAYEVVESLTTEVGPRLAGSQAEARARKWGVAKFGKLGFSNPRIEPFQILKWVRHGESARIVSPYPQPLVVTALGNSMATPKGGLEGEVVRFETLSDLQEAPSKGLEGKIVFVDEFMTRSQDGSGYGMAVRKRSGAANEAARRGAKAALIRSVGTDHFRRPHTGVMRYEPGVTPVPIAALSAPDADQLTRALSRGAVVVELDLHTEGGGRTGAVWDTKGKGAPSGNVIAEVPGRTDEIVLVGAHLDSWDLGTGALDDGAGIGIIMGAASLLKSVLPKPRRTIRVVLFGAEEVGLAGAKAYADRHVKELDRHIIAAESDFGARKIWRMQTRWGEGALVHAPLFHRAIRRLGVAPDKRNEAYGGPDLGFLRKAGVPVVTFTQNGWDYFDYHHTPDDTFDKIDPEELRQNVAVYAAFLYLSSELGIDFRAKAAKESSEVPAKR